MKKLLISALLLVLSLTRASGQYYEVPKRKVAPTTMNILYYGIYKIGNDGLYYYDSSNEAQTISAETFYEKSIGNEHYFGYCKSNKMYFFYTDNIIGAYQHTTNNNYYWERNLPKEIKQNKVKNISMKELPALLANIVKERNDFYKKKNDSILIQKDKNIKDSIENAQKKQMEMTDYRRTHDWHDLTMSNDYGIMCQYCGINHYSNNYFVISISADTLYYFLEKPDISFLDINYMKIHYSKLTQDFKRDIWFKEYINIWRDSIANNNRYNNNKADRLNEYRFNIFKEKVNKTAPDGFIQKWGWNLNSADGIEPYFSFFNSSKKTIKYIDFYFSIYNDVGDKCYLRYNKSYIGEIRGVGPIVSFDSGSWNWNRATHYTSGDASEMKIIKLVITYMDGTKKTILRDSIIYEE